MKDDSTLWNEAYGIAMGDDEKAVIWYGVLKDEEMRKTHGRREELYKGQRRVNFLIFLGVLGCVVLLSVIGYYILLFLDI